MLVVEMVASVELAVEMARLHSKHGSLRIHHLCSPGIRADHTWRSNRSHLDLELDLHNTHDNLQIRRPCNPGIHEARKSTSSHNLQPPKPTSWKR